MSLEMYAFSLARSPAFPTPSSVLRYKVPKDGRLVGGAAGQAFLDSNLILPGSTLIQAWTDHPSLHEWMEREWNRARGFFKARTMGMEDRVVLKYPELSRLHFDIAQAIAQVWGQRRDNYSEQCSAQPDIATQRKRVEMSYIGG